MLLPTVLDVDEVLFATVDVEDEDDVELDELEDVELEDVDDDELDDVEEEDDDTDCDDADCVDRLLRLLKVLRELVLWLLKVDDDELSELDDVELLDVFEISD